MLDSILGAELTLSAFLICTAASLLLGVGTALTAQYRARTTQSFAVALAILPAVVQVVIMLVNGNLGAGVAVAGAFSLVRFRSAPGTARDILVIFLAMTVGLACGMGYCALAIFAAVVTCLVFLAQKEPAAEASDRDIRVTVPENLDYAGLFADLFEKYTTSCQLLEVKTVNMGSLFRLHYRVRLKNGDEEKQLLDAMRCRNGNLEISCGLSAWEKQRDTL